MDTTYFNPAHLGFVDGLKGVDPNPVYSKDNSYTDSWLTASALSTKEKAHWLKALTIAESQQFKRGSQVIVPKGTTLRGGAVTRKAVKVTLHDVYYSQAYVHFGFNGEFQFPTANVLWAGSGGLWKEASVADVELVDAPAATASVEPTAV